MNNTLSKLLAHFMCAAFTCGITVAAHAANWAPVEGAANKTLSLYVDLSSIKFLGTHAKAWFMFDNLYSIDVPGTLPAQRYLSEKQLELFDCSQNTSGTTQAIYYEGRYGSGDVKWSGSTNPASVSYTDVIPDTVGEAMLKSVCSHQQKSKSRKDPSAAGM